MKREKSIQQECIPVGCIPSASVVATRCRYKSVGLSQRPPFTDPLSQNPPCTKTFTLSGGTGNKALGPTRPRRNMPPGSETGSDIIQRPTPSFGQKDRQIWKHYLASNLRAVTSLLFKRRPVISIGRKGKKKVKSPLRHTICKWRQTAVGRVCSQAIKNS